MIVGGLTSTAWRRRAAPRAKIEPATSELVKISDSSSLRKEANKQPQGEKMMQEDRTHHYHQQQEHQQLVNPQQLHEQTHQDSHEQNDHPDDS